MSLPPPPPPPSTPPPGSPAPPPFSGAPDPAGAAVCYKHGNRPAYRRCTRCERLACNDCLVPGSVGSLCPDCVRSTRAPAPERLRRWNATRGGTAATFALIAANVGVAVYTLSSPLVARGVHRGEYELAVNRYFVDAGEWYRIVTSGFTHFGLFHLVMNMVSLYFLGRFVEPAIGQVRFLALYLASMLAGTAGALMLQPGFGITAGASGAVFGLMGAAAVGMRQRGISLMQSGIGTTLLLNLLITFTISGISIGGHLGGLAGGVICGSVMLAPRQRRIPTWAVWLVPLAVVAVSVVLCFVVSHDVLNTFRR